MMKRIFGELPDWAKQENPLLRYELVRRQDKSESRIGRIAMWVIGLSLLLLGGYLYATDGLQRSLQLPYTLDIWRVLIFPALCIQITLRVAGIVLGAGAITDERQRQTWDNLRATEQGANLGLRTRLVSVFYRLKGLIFSIFAIRFILLGAILYELTSFQGAYLDLLTARANPTISVEIGVILLAGFMTAFLMIPITATAVDIGLGLLISTTIRNRAISTVMQVLVIVFRVVSSLMLFWLTWQMLESEMTSGGMTELSLLTTGGIFADWGLSLSQLTLAGQLWAAIPYAVFTGIFMLIAVLVQVAIAGGLMILSVRLAEVRG